MKKYRNLLRLVAMFIVTIAVGAMWKFWVAPEFSNAKDEVYEKVEAMQQKVATQREDVFEVGDVMFGEDDVEWQMAKMQSREATSRDIKMDKQATPPSPRQWRNSKQLKSKWKLVG